MQIDIRHIVGNRPTLRLTSNGLTGECVVSDISRLEPIDQHGELMLMEATIRFSVSMNWLERCVKAGDQFIFKTDSIAKT